MTKPVHPIYPNAILIGDKWYLNDAKGDLRALDRIPAQDLLMDELVRKCTAYAQDISGELGRFQLHCWADIAGFDALLQQQYGVEPNTETKGNRTFTSFDGCQQVKVQVSDRIQLGPELQVAKQLLDKMILARADKDGADPFLVTLVTQAFKVDQEGKVDVSAILALRRMEMDDPDWRNVIAAIDAAVRIIGTKRYIRFYQRARQDGEWQMVPLDIAKTIPVPADLERKSLRRTVEEGRETLSYAISCLLSGQPVNAMELLDEALRVLGADGVDPAQMQGWRDLYAEETQAA